MAKLEVQKKYSLGEAFAVFAVGSLMLPVATVITIPLALLTAWIRMQLWAWFAVPYLHLPQVALLPMWGFGLLLSTFTAPNSLKKEYREGNVWSQIMWAQITNLLALVVGYVLHHYWLMGK